MTCADYWYWRKETLAEARRRSDQRDQAIIQQHNREREQRRFNKIVLNVEAEGLFTYHKGVFSPNPKITADEWHFYYDIAQSNIVYAVLEDWR